MAPKKEAPPKADNPTEAKHQSLVDNPLNVHQAIIETGRVLKAVGKDQRNQQQNFNYRSIHGLMNALQPAMAAAGLYCHLLKYDNMKEETWKTNNGAQGRRITLDAHYKFTAADGTSIETMTPGEAFDYGDKGIGKALVYAQKNLILQTFMVPTEDTKDPDENAHDFTERIPNEQKKPAAKPAEKPKPAPPVDDAVKQLAETIKEAYQAAPDTGILEGAVKEFAADFKTLPEPAQTFLQGVHDSRMADFFCDAYDNAGSFDEVNTINDRIKAHKPPLIKAATDRLEAARIKANTRIDADDILY